MNISAPGGSAALALWDPEFTDADHLALVRAVLAQARHDTAEAGVAAGIDPALVDRWADRLGLRHRVGPLVHRGWPTAERRDEVRRLTFAQLALDAASRRITAGLAEAGIDSRVLKGLATAELDYPDPTLRHTGDVDLLVRRCDLQATVDALVAAGGVPLRRVATEFDHMQGATVVLPYGESSVEVDVHFRLSRYLPTPDAEAEAALFAEPEALPGGRLALSAAGRLVHAAVHGVLSTGEGRRLSSLADLVVLADRFDAEPERWGEVEALAHRLGAAAVVGEALAQEAAITGRAVLSNAVSPGRPEWPALDPVTRRAFVSDRHHPVASQLVALRHLASWRDRAAYAAAWVRPDDEVAARRGGRVAYLTRLAGRLGPGRPAPGESSAR